MAARAHVFHDHPFGRATPRPRREVWFRDRDDEPIVLPRSSLFRLGGGLLLALTAGAAIVAGSAYAAYHTDAPSLLPTPTSPLVKDWQPDPELTRANVTNQLSGPALAVPNHGAPSSAATEAAAAVTGNGLPHTATAPSRSSSSRDDEIILDDRALNPPSELPQVPYPNPTTTPPDGVAPPDSAPQTPTPPLEPDNPYRDLER